MSVYSSPAAAAVRLLTKFGRPVTLIKTTTGEYDPATGTVSQSTSSFPAVAADFAYELRDIDGTTIQRGDKRMLMAPDVAQAPANGDVVQVGGESWSVISVDTLAPAGEPVLYTLQVRK